MLILKENAANSVPTPPVGKDTFFIDDSGTPSIKNSAGTVTTFPVVNASNAQVVFMNGSSLSGEAAFTYDFNNNVLNVTGNIAAGNVKTDNLLYANGTAWDLSDPGGSNTQVQFNDDESFGGSAAFTFNKTSNLVSMGGALSVTGNANIGNIGTAGQIIASGNVSGNYFIGNGSQLTGIDATAIQNGTANVRTFNNGNVTVSAAGTANVVVVTSTGANISGTANITGNANVGNLGTTELAVSGNAIISGNLTVDGNLVYVNVETVAVEDPIIQLQTGPNGAAPSSNSGKDVGTALNYYDTQARVAFMGWDTSNAEFGMASQASISSEVVTFSQYGNLRAQTFKGNVDATTVAVSGTSNIAAVNLGGHIIPTLDETYDLGNATNRFRDLWISGNSIRIGNSRITSNATSLILQNPDGGQVVVSGNSIASSTSIVSGTSNVSIPTANGNVNTSVNGTANVLVVTSTGANINGTLNATGNANVGNLGTGGLITATGNVSGGNLTTAGALSVTGNANVGNLGTGGLITATGNVSGGNITTAGQLVSSASTGTAPLVVSSTTVVANLRAATSNVANTVNDAAQPNITSVGTLTSLAVTGNATAGNVYANSGTVGASLLTGTLTTGSQPNITSVGTLSSLTVSGNGNLGNIGATAGVFTGNISSLNANLGNLITANVANLVDLNVSGNTNIGTGSGGNISGANVITANTFVGNLQGIVANGNSNVSIPAANGNVNISAVGTANVLVVTGTGVNVSGTLNSSGNANVGNLGTGGLIVATGNVTGGNLVTSGALSVTGNANVGNLGTGGLITATGNVSGGNLTTAGQLVSSVSTGTAPLVVSSTTKVANLNADLLDGYSTDTAATANTVVIRDTNGSFSANVVTANLSGNATTAGTVTTAAQPNITSVGTLTGLGVNGNITAANITANTGVFTGNGSGLSSLAGGNVTGQVANALVAGTVYTAAQPNITSVGTLTSVAVTGDVTAGNVYANSGTIGASLLTGTLTTAAQPNITSLGTLSSLAVTGNVAAGNLTTTGVLSVTGTGVSSIAGNLDMTSNNIINLATPVNANDAATKQYVDDVAQGLHTHDSCNAATDGTLATISGGTVTYNNGSSGVGATLTTTGSYTTIDGVTLSNGMRILVKNEANSAHNGIYDRTSSTVLTRSSDFDTPTEMAGGDFTFVTAGTLYDNTGWVMTDPVTTVGTSPVPWVQFSGAGTYTAGTGLTLTGSQFSVNASQTQVTALGNVTSGTWNSLVGASATFAAGLSGANLASITGGNVTGQVANALVAGTVYTAAQPNITSVGTLTSLGVNGTVTAVAFTANTGVFTGNGSGLSALAGGNVTGQVGNALVAGTVYTAAQPNITSVGTLTSLSVTGNANVGNIGAAAGVFTTVSGNGAALTDLNASNISSGTLAQARLANASLTVNGVSITLGGSGTVTASTTNTLTLGSYLTGGSFNGGTAVTAAVDATSANTASKVVARDASGNFSAGTITATLSGAATTAGTVTTAAQPNITSVGTLTGLTLANASTISVGSNTNVGTFTGNFSLSAGSRLNATYADLAEKYVADADYEPGTVLIFGGEHEVTLANEENSHRVAGVVSTNPAYTMNSACEGEHVVDLALQGRVPVKVHGPVSKGDLMVSGLNGHAVANNMARAGTIIGKALQNFSGDHGVIEVVVGRF